MAEPAVEPGGEAPSGPQTDDPPNTDDHDGRAATSAPNGDDAAPTLAEALKMPFRTDDKGSGVKDGTPGQVLVKDFAFPPSDPRHSGLPGPAAATSWNPPWAGRKAGKSAEAEDSGSGAGRWGWSLLAGGMTDTFESSGPSETSEASLEEAEQEGAEDDEEEVEVAEGALYVATFAFQAEGESEMDLAPDDVVRVFSPPCKGWVVANKVQVDAHGLVLDGDPEGANCGLCPFSYLRRWPDAA